MERAQRVPEKELRVYLWSQKSTEVPLGEISCSSGPRTKLGGCHARDSCAQAGRVYQPSPRLPVNTLLPCPAVSNCSLQLHATQAPSGRMRCSSPVGSASPQHRGSPQCIAKHLLSKVLQELEKDLKAHSPRGIREAGAAVGLCWPLSSRSSVSWFC